MAAGGGDLPVNLTALIEGGGGDRVRPPRAFVAANADLLRADVAVISDTNQFARGSAITYGLRGLVYEEVFLTGPDHDLHSGMYAGRSRTRPTCCANCSGSLHDATAG
jgi:hypothetical protein